MKIFRGANGFLKSFVTTLKIAVRSFSKQQLTVFYILCILLVISTVLMLGQINKKYLVEVPAYGGKIDEGIIGTPRFINPLLASSDADKDLTALIYSGLTKKDSRGEIVPDLAENYTISPDGLTYTFTLHSDAVFHDGTPVTTDDVLYTITEAKCDQVGLLCFIKITHWKRCK
jgi:peptide/nickel transport system substrate-binding protein